MNVRHVRILCWSFTAAAALAAGVMLTASVLLPLDANAGSEAVGPTRARIAATPPPALTMNDFEQLLTGRLRPGPPPAPVSAPVVASIVETAPIAPPAPEAASVSLLGTVVETNNSYAIFQTADGVEVKRQGDTVGGSRIESITDGTVILKKDADRVTLQVPPPAGG